MDKAFSNAARPPVIVVINRDADFLDMLARIPEFTFGRTDVEVHGFRTVAEAAEFLESRQSPARKGCPPVDLIMLPVYNDEFKIPDEGLLSFWRRSRHMDVVRDLSGFESGPFLEKFSGAAKHVLLIATYDRALEIAENADLPENVALYPLSFFPKVLPFQDVIRQVLALPAGEKPPVLFQRMTVQQECEWLATSFAY